MGAFIGCIVGAVMILITLVMCCEEIGGVLRRIVGALNRIACALENNNKVDVAK